MTTQSSLKHQIRVGAFVLVALIVVLTSLFLIGGDRLMERYVTLHAHFEHVQGLNQGSLVSLQGIRIGTIKKFVFVPEKNQVDVWMNISESFLPRITQGSQVEVRTAGALGDKFIFIQPGDPQKPMVRDGDTLETVPPTDIMGMIAEKGAEANKVFEIINEVHRLTKSINAENRVDKIMRNFADASQNLKETSSETKELISEIKNQNSQKLSSSIDKLDKILTKIDHGEGTLGALINDSSLHESLKAMVGGSERKKNIKSLIRSSIENKTNEPTGSN